MSFLITFLLIGSVLAQNVDINGFEVVFILEMDGMDRFEYLSNPGAINTAIGSALNKLETSTVASTYTSDNSQNIRVSVRDSKPLDETQAESYKSRVAEVSFMDDLQDLVAAETEFEQVEVKLMAGAVIEDLKIKVTDGSVDSSACRCISTPDSEELTDITILGQEGHSYDQTIGSYVGTGSSDEQQVIISKGYGEYCNFWEQTTFTPYAGDCNKNTIDHSPCGSDNFCYAAWCYVTEACKNDPRYATFPTDAWSATRPSLHYSYQICGYAACFGDNQYAPGCPNDVQDSEGNDIVCPSEGCVCNGVSNGRQIAYDKTKSGELEDHICTVCPGQNANDLVDADIVMGDTIIKCKVCNTGARFDPPATPCVLPRVEPERYVFGPGANITLCTTLGCNSPVFDITCAEGYSGEIRAQNDECATNGGFATMSGCIADAPETLIYNKGTEDKPFYVHVCSRDDQCRPQNGWCNNPNGGITWGDDVSEIVKQQNGVCVFCPVDISKCQDSSYGYELGTKCSAACDPATSTYVRSACGVDAQCQDMEFCMLPAWVTEANADNLAGLCQPCSIVDPKGTSQCSYSEFAFENVLSKASCSERCKQTDAQRTTIVTPPDYNNDFARFSALESLENSETGLSYYGYCSSAARRDNCENGAKRGSAEQYNYEINQCARRYCSNTIPSHCILQIEHNNETCVASHQVTLNGQSTTISIAGRCVNGECLASTASPVECPDGYVQVSNGLNGNSIVYNNNYAYYDAPMCGTNKSPTFSFAETFNKNKCVLSTSGISQTCQNIPRANKAFSTSYAHQDGQWPPEDRTKPNVNDHWANEVGSVDTQFFFMLFTTDLVTPFTEAQKTDPRDSVPGPNSNYFKQLTIAANNDITLNGRGLVCDPEMPTSLQEQYACLISDFGSFYYQGSEIDFYGFSNITTRILHYEAEPNMVSVIPTMLCGDNNSNKNCFGAIASQYFSSTNLGALYGNLCSDEYPICEEGTVSPTHMPTHSPISTAHGDPIIWTFHDECYDLNMDGLYVATANPKFNHVVKLGVYNDFMRELQVVSTNGEVLLSINSLGEYEKSDNFLYRFKYEEKECPVGMKDTECVGTYKEWMFDAQEFEYTVHLLRHDYKDNGIPEGDLGYHLDIYPRPYKSFREPGHMDSYSGLFFENPLPEELPYCVGGSKRNENIKLEQSKPRDATVFA